MLERLSSKVCVRVMFVGCYLVMLWLAGLMMMMMCVCVYDSGGERQSVPNELRVRESEWQSVPWALVWEVGWLPLCNRGVPP